jgi:FkbM family methyltransferase
MLSILRYRGFFGLIRAIYFRLLIIIFSRFQRKRYIKSKIYDYAMYLDVQDPGISRTLLLFGKREIEHKIMLNKVLQPGMTVLDIGANIGYYAIMEAKLVGTTGRIIAVEPSPNNIQLLKRNLELNNYGNIKVIQGAISDRAGEREFHLSSSSNLHTFHNHGSAAHQLTGETIVVNTYSVTDVMSGMGKPDLIRMDVEGHEVEVIDGMMDAIQRNELSPMILFETHISRYSKEHNMAATLKRLFDLGYYVRYLASNAESGSAKIEARGYRGSQPIKTDFVKRVIYENIKPEDAIDLICTVGGCRTVLLAPRC